MSITFRAEKFDGDMFRGVEGGPEVNLSNGNAGAVLSAIGLDLAPDFCGSISPAEFRARVDRFRLAVSQGQASEFGSTPGIDPATRLTLAALGAPKGMEVVSRGLDAYDILNRLAQILNVAKFAELQGADVGWG